MLPCKAEQWEPDELRGSRPVLRAAGGEIPPADSPSLLKTVMISQESTLQLTNTNKLLHYEAFTDLVFKTSGIIITRIIQCN